MAPGQTLSADLEVDPSGTEVAIDYIIKLKDTENITPIEIQKIMCKVDGEEPEELILENDEYSYFENLDNVLANKKVTFSVYVRWLDTSKNAVDTNIGASVSTIDIPLEITVRQHI